MPRLTDSNYLINRHLLLEVWEQHWGQLAQLPTFAQRDLHRFYGMSEDLSDDEALARRKVAAAREPSLPQQSGRAFAQLERVMHEAVSHSRAPSPTVPQPGRRGRRREVTVRVSALARPDNDYERLARALLEHAMDEIEKTRNSDKN